MRVRLLRVAVLAAVMVAGADAEAAVEQWLGRNVADVRVEAAGRPFLEPAVLELIETRVGEPLTMRRVRATIDHLVGLGRFEDVRVLATPFEDAVVIEWRLMPVQRIASVSVGGSAALSSREIRAELLERHGTLPPVARVPDMVETLRTYYADRGYRHAAIAPTIDAGAEEFSERVTLALAIDAGARTSVGDAAITGTPLESQTDVLRKLGLERGQPYDAPALQARLDAYEEDLRGRGYYEARVRETRAFAPDGATVSMTVDVETGPRVRVMFQGDSLPVSEGQALAPIRDERSVDQDLLEDASRSIESALRQQGYRAAQAPYTRREEPSALVLTFTISRGPLYRVASVDVAGASALPREEFAPLLQIKPDEPFVEARVGIVAAAIAELYRVRGFLEASVTPDVQVLPAETRNNVSFRPVQVRFDIIEGPQTIVDAVDITGATALPAESVKALLGLSPGHPFYRPLLAADLDAIDRMYRNRGFQSVSVDSQLTFGEGRRTVRVAWTIEEGEQITVDRILINGNVRSSVDSIRREMTLQPGSPMSDDAIIDSQRRLAATGLFRRVRITELPRTGASTRDVLVEVEEAEATTISYGGGFEMGRRLSDRDGGLDERLDVAPRGFLDISRRNFWGKNRSATLFGRVTLRRSDSGVQGADQAGTTTYGLNDYRALFSFREPRAFGSGGDGQLTAFIEQAQRTSFDFNRKGVSVDYARRIRTFTATGRYTFDYTKLFGERIQQEDQLLIDRLFPQVKMSKVFASVLRDSRDDVLDPQRGSVLGLDASVAAKVMGSEVGFLKTFAQGFVYRRLPGRGVVLAAGARVGIAVGFVQEVPPVIEIASAQPDLVRTLHAAEFQTQIRELPASERFFAGGDTTVRGFSLDRLGTVETLDSQGFPQGGNGLAVFNLEARAPYWKNIQFVWFVDAGNVFRQASDIRLDELRMTSGLGLRYRSPIGPIRVDWGWKISTRLLLAGGRERSNVLHISLGQAF